MTSNEIYIQSKLRDLAVASNVKILLAIESGSRAWGFPSEDSDYDVRFIYVREQDDYLSVREFRDVIETPLVNDEFLKVPIDLNGWDVRKALRLGLKSNAVLIEWLKSPVQYMADKNILPQFHDFILRNADIPSLLYHYDRLAKHAWQEIDACPDSVKIKRYFYGLRPALACAWMRQHHQAPPMNILELATGLDLPKGFIEQLHQFIETKRKAMESDVVERSPVFDDYLCKVLSEPAARPDQSESSPHDVTEADQFFRNWIS